MMNDMLPPNRGQSRSGPGYLPRFSQNNGSHHRALPHQAAHPFRSPQFVAAQEEQRSQTNSATELLDEQGGQAPPPPKKRRSFKEWWRSLSKKKKIILSVITALVLIGLSVAAYFLFFKSDPPPPVKKSPEQKREVVQQPTTVPSTLTGLQVDPSVNERPVIAVMIENSVDARPQAGLKDAGVVFEAIAEGGITRFVALFQDTEPDPVGPVRSARPYYIQWIMGFDAAYAHAGGSPEALSNIQQWGTKDLNHHASYFWRVSNRTAPHNLYSSVTKLREYAAQKGFGKSNYTGFSRKVEQPLGSPHAKSIDLNISSANFKAHYDYDSATNSYKRSVGGAPHNDEKSGSQITPKVVVALVMPQGKNGVYTTYGTIGSGVMYVFQDGFVTEGTWRKDANNSQFVFTDKSGKVLKLNPGQTWISILGSSANLSYSP